MRHLKLALLVAALTACVGASECSGSGSSGSKASANFGSGGIDPPGSDGGDPVTPTPEPSGALLFGLGTLIAAAATRRLNTPRD